MSTEGHAYREWCACANCAGIRSACAPRPADQPAPELEPVMWDGAMHWTPEEIS